MKILIPADFTEVSLNAIRYAFNAYSATDEYHLVHVNKGHLDPRKNTPLEEGTTLVKAIENRLQVMLGEQFHREDIPVKTHIRVLAGEIVSTITKLAHDEKFDIVVAGTRDRYEMYDRWFGTVSLGLAKRLNIPLYLIPRHAGYQSYQKVIVASDRHLRNPSLIDKITTWNTNYKAHIKFLHVSEEASDSFEEESRTIIREMFEKKEPDFGFEISVVKGEDVTESLLAHAYNNKADLLIMIAEKQTFLQNMLFKNVSKDIILKSAMPLLFLPEEN